MRKLVIGCGYLGKRVAERWKQQGDDVFVLTRSDENARRFHEEGLSPIVGDVVQPETLMFPEDIETCLYAVGLDRSAGFSQRDVYVDGLQNVFVIPAKTIDLHFEHQRLRPRRRRRNQRRISGRTGS